MSSLTMSHRKNIQLSPVKIKIQPKQPLLRNGSPVPQQKAGPASPIRKSHHCTYVTRKRLKRRHYAIFSREIVEGIFLEISNLYYFIALLMLTLGFGSKNVWLNSNNINLQNLLGLHVKKYFSVESKFKSNHKGRALYGIQVGALSKWHCLLHSCYLF